MARTRVGGAVKGVGNQGVTSTLPSSPGSQPPQQVSIKDFPGLQTNLDAGDIPLGAGTDQVNVVGERVGYFAVRMGWVRVLFRN